MRRIHLHIGPHKTGSTYLQKCLFLSRDQLHREGIYYPPAAVQEHFGHHTLAELYSTSKYNQAKIHVERIIDEYSGDILISSENFDRLKDADIVELKKHISHNQVHVVFYSRNPGDLLVSSWQEDIKHGSTTSWSQYFFNHLLKPFSSPVLNKRLILDRYAFAFGKRNISIIDYDSCAAMGGDIYEMLTKAVGLAGMGSPIKGTKVNKSMSYERVEIIRALNSLFIQEGYQVNHQVRSAFLNYAKHNPECGIISNLERCVSRQLESVSFDAAFTINRMNKYFLSEYEERIINPMAGDENCVTTYGLPSDIWLTDTDAVPSLKRLKDRLDVLLRDKNESHNAMRYMGNTISQSAK